jgi:hypothetical protein
MVAACGGHGHGSVMADSAGDTATASRAMLVLAGCQQGTLAWSSFTEAGAWSPLAPMGSTCFVPNALPMRGPAPGLAVIGETSVAVTARADASLAYSTFDRATWSAARPVFPDLRVAFEPALTSTSTGAYLLVAEVPVTGVPPVHGASFDGEVWSALEDTGLTTSGPPRVAAASGTIVATLAHAFGREELVATKTTSWAATSQNWNNDDLLDANPVIATGATGAAAPDFEFIWHNDHSHLWYSQRESGMWSAVSLGKWVAPVPVTNATDAYAITRTSKGTILIVYVATSGGVWSLEQPSAGAPFGAPVSIDATLPSTTLVALAPGLGGSDAELVVTTGSQLRHARWKNGSWSPWNLIPGGTVDEPGLVTLPG